MATAAPQKKPPAAEKKVSDGNIQIPKTWLYPILVLAMGAFGFSGANFVSPNARNDPFTGTQAREMEDRFIAEMAKWSRRMSDHEALPYHTEAGVSLSGVKAQLDALSADMGEVKIDVRDIRKKVNGGG